MRAFFSTAALTAVTYAISVNLNNIERGTEDELNCDEKTPLNIDPKTYYWEFNPEACACFVVWKIGWPKE